ncbi:MAG: hypothetical protein KGI38_11825 [Thaumarchaeota archaeon]|nr:hypothetical protein [Nitrososphaerota archaeon]
MKLNLYLIAGVGILLYALYVPTQCLFGCSGINSVVNVNDQFVGGIGVVLILIGVFGGKK